MQEHRLCEKLFVRLLGIPLHYGVVCPDLRLAERCGIDGLRRTMWGKGCKPFVESGVDLRHNLGKPLFRCEPKQHPRFVQGILLLKAERRATSSNSWLTMARKIVARIWFRRMSKVNAVKVLGLPSGCLNRLCGSPWSQYRSSHSTGRSRSKLFMVLAQGLRRWETDVLFFMEGAWTTSGSAQVSIERY
jgi:hypothetical protein